MNLNFFKNSGDDHDAYKSIAKNAKEYGDLYLQLFKLNAVGTLSQFVSYLIVIIAGVILLMTALVFLAVILILWLKNATGSLIYSLLIMSGVFLLLFLILLLFALTDVYGAYTAVENLAGDECMCGGLLTGRRSVIADP